MRLDEVQVLQRELAQREFAEFVRFTKPDYNPNWHHNVLCSKIDDFARGKIKKMMVFMPPQHGKSELATRRYPAYQLGLNPKTKIAICSYSDTIATSFNRDIQRVIDDEPFSIVFPDTYLNESNVVTTTAKNDFLRNNSIFETVGHRGYVVTVGVGGSLTSRTVDIGIIDDPFKDRQDAMSTKIRETVWSWYTDVFKTRLHNDSQQLVIMTRWHPEDLAGKILAQENDWEVVVFQAIKEKEYPNDPRATGEALWPVKHSLERILAVKRDSPVTFNSLYQQEPRVSDEQLVFPEWSEIDQMPDFNKVYGIDFGFSNDPTAIIEVQKHNKDMFVREWLYKKGLVNSEIIAFIKANFSASSLFIADSAEPKTIEEMRRAGIKIYPAIKGKDSVLFGLNYIKDHKIHVYKGSHNLKNEMLNYQWGVDGFDHLIDGWRYAATTKIGSQSTTMLLR